MNKILSLTLFFSFFVLLSSKGQNFSSKKDSINYHKNKKLVVPLGLIGLGTALNSSSLKKNQESWHNTNVAGFKTSADNILSVTPNLFALGLNHLGVKSKSNARDKFFLIGMANAISMAGTIALKNITKQNRPDKSEFTSFPSGHTSIAFTGAQLIHEEYGHHGILMSIAAYGTATAVAGLRITNNKHWLADVVFGAGYGILSTKLAYKYYPKIKPKLGKLANKTELKIDPIFAKNSIGGSLKLRF